MDNKYTIYKNKYIEIKEQIGSSYTEMNIWDKRNYRIMKKISEYLIDLRLDNINNMTLLKNRLRFLKNQNPNQIILNKINFILNNFKLCNTSFLGLGPTNNICIKNNRYKQQKLIYTYLIDLGYTDQQLQGSYIPSLTKLEYSRYFYNIFPNIKRQLEKRLQTENNINNYYKIKYILDNYTKICYDDNLYTGHVDNEKCTGYDRNTWFNMY